MMKYSLYIVDDEQTIRDGIMLTLEQDYNVLAFSNAEDAVQTAKKKTPDLILLDIGLPGMSGIDALREFKKFNPDLVVIMITAFEDIKTVISAMKLGAYDYVVKPLQMDGLEITIRNALDKIKLKKEVQLLHEKYLKEHMPCFIGESEIIHDVMDFINMIAKSPDTPILILGETGTGKELIANAIHYRSPNYMGPFITVNCAAIPKDLIESELFGYEKGAFSGARSTGKKGMVEVAENGTLFLDEVADLSSEAQAKLLRFLDEGEFYKVGGTQKRKIQTRIISATNKDLDRMVENEQFRSDLIYRLGVVKVEVPSLNERRDDILALATHFLFTFSQKFAKEISGLSSSAEQALVKHEWTGNVRELKNVIERGVLVCKSPEISVHDLGLQKTLQKDKNIFIPSQGLHLDDVLEDIEWSYIEEAFRMAEGNESKAARILNMNHHTYRYRRKKLKLRCGIPNQDKNYSD